MNHDQIPRASFLDPDTGPEKPSPTPPIRQPKKANPPRTLKPVVTPVFIPILPPVRPPPLVSPVFVPLSPPVRPPPLVSPVFVLFSPPGAPPAPLFMPPPPPPPSSPPPPLSPPPSSPPPSYRPPSSQPSHKNRNTSGPVVGAAVGGSILAVTVLCALLFFLLKKRKNTPDHNGQGLVPHIGSRNGAKGEFLISVVDSNVSTSNPKLPSSTGSNTSSSTQSVTPKSTGAVSLTYEELTEATNCFSKDSILGQGGFGYVYKGVLRNGNIVAIKQLKEGSFQGEREFQSEIEIISRIHHRNLVSLVGYNIEGSHRLLIYEYVANNSLAFHLHASESPLLKWATRMDIALGSAKGLAYLHEDCDPRIIHRDIKATNILLDVNFKPKVSDFGLAKFVLDADTHVTTRVMGTLGYLAPEYASSGKLTEKSDVYSFGIVLLELISGRQPIDMVDWARPLLDKALEEGDFIELVDQKLEQQYDTSEMIRMVVCAQSCIHPFAQHRPHMIQIARVLEGIMSPDDIKVRHMDKIPTRSPRGSLDDVRLQGGSKQKSKLKMRKETQYVLGRFLGLYLHH